MIPLLRRLTGGVKFVEIEHTINITTNDLKPIDYGEFVPDFEINTVLGEKTTLYEILETSPVVLSFFRGGWCPTCNIEINHLEKELEQFDIKNIRLLGITPDSMTHAQELKNRRKISFDLVSDPNNEIASLFDIVVPLKNSLPAVYHRSVERHLNKSIDQCFVPIPATYIIDRTGRVMLTHVDFDYTKRIKPSEIHKLISSTPVEMAMSA